jgi:hypothetical protein
MVPKGLYMGGTIIYYGTENNLPKLQGKPYNQVVQEKDAEQRTYSEV